MKLTKKGKKEGRFSAFIGKRAQNDGGHRKKGSRKT